jgi:NAD(P)-dependent dehydrogenase (short-subunit alcohol dehydrogenase family)
VDPYLPYIPLGRSGESYDISDAVRFLADPAASWITARVSPSTAATSSGARPS